MVIQEKKKCSLATHGLGLAAVGQEIVDGHLDVLEVLQPLDRLAQQLKVEGVRVVKVVVVVGRLLVLLLRQHLSHKRFSKKKKENLLDWMMRAEVETSCRILTKLLVRVNQVCLNCISPSLRLMLMNMPTV